MKAPHAAVVLGCAVVVACGNHYALDTPNGGTIPLTNGDAGVLASDAASAEGGDTPPSVDGGPELPDGGTNTAPCEVRCDSAHCGTDGVCEPLVFITQGKMTGVMASSVGTGIRSADAICNHEAMIASKTGTYVAWLSTDVIDAYHRIGVTTAGTDRPVWLSSGQQVANSYDDMALNGELFTSITRTAMLTVVTSNDGVWTGTGINAGSSTGQTCADWSFGGGTLSGTTGALSDTGRWTQDSTQPCDAMNHLYCFEVAP